MCLLDGGRKENRRQWRREFYASGRYPAWSSQRVAADYSRQATISGLVNGCLGWSKWAVKLRGRLEAKVDVVRHVSWYVAQGSQLSHCEGSVSEEVKCKVGVEWGPWRDADGERLLA